MRVGDTNGEDRAALAWRAIAWILSDDARAGRLIALTGVTAEDLRARIDDPALHEAVFAHLAAYQPDLISCAESIGADPALLVPRTDLT
jgi:hypothetical protein